jgi:hypothetical protein
VGKYLGTSLHFSYGSSVNLSGLIIMCDPIGTSSETHKKGN